MGGVFDEQEAERLRTRRDPEVTLGFGTLVAMFFGLVLLCGVCFGLGYAVGHRGPLVSTATDAQPAASEPAQAEANGAKPTATGQSKAVAAPQSAQEEADPAAATVEPKATTEAKGPTEPKATTGAPSPQAGAAGALSGPGQTAPEKTPPGQTRVAAPVVVPVAAPEKPVAPVVVAGPKVQPALPAMAAFKVQIAALSHAEDAAVLVAALRKRGYTVTAQQKPEDGLFHVWLGPFSTRDEANRLRQELLDDGYNAIVQP